MTAILIVRGDPAALDVFKSFPSLIPNVMLNMLSKSSTATSSSSMSGQKPVFPVLTSTTAPAPSFVSPLKLRSWSLLGE